MDIIMVLPVCTECTGQEILAAILTAALAALVAASVAYQTWYSSADSVFLAKFLCQVDWDMIFFSAAVLRGDTGASTVTAAKGSFAGSQRSFLSGSSLGNYKYRF